MPKFRKKPVVIEAVQFNGGNTTEVANFIGGKHSVGTSPTYVEIHTLEGIMTASVNDWIIKGVSGEFYPCKPEIFEKTY